MRIGLFIPCYIDQLYPHVGLATVKVLERFGVEIDFPTAQTCCGQPMANTGLTSETKPLALKFFEIFKDYDNIVCPSGSCTAMVRHHLVNRSRPIRRTSTGRDPAANCTSCCLTMAAATSWAATNSAGR